MTDNRCEVCIYYLEDHPGADGGDCRRYPPITVIDDDGAVTCFPSVPPSWYCGEFVRRVN